MAHMSRYDGLHIHVCTMNGEESKQDADEHEISFMVELADADICCRLVLSRFLTH